MTMTNEAEEYLARKSFLREQAEKYKDKSPLRSYMVFSFLECVFTGGRYKLYCIGKPDSHIFEWRGSNFHRVLAPGQKRNGFATFEEARLALVQAAPTEADLAKYCGTKVGTHAADETPEAFKARGGFNVSGTYPNIELRTVRT